MSLLPLAAEAEGVLTILPPLSHRPQADRVKNFWSPFSHVAFLCQVEEAWNKVVDTYYFLLCRVSMGQNSTLRCGLLKLLCLEMCWYEFKSWLITLGSLREPFSSPWTNWAGLAWNLKEKEGKGSLVPLLRYYLILSTQQPGEGSETHMFISIY